MAAALAVVGLHVAANTLVAAPFAGMAWWSSHVLDSALRWCVPVFVMATGATLITPRVAAQPLRAFYVRRFARVAVPILVWSVFYLVWPWLAGRVAAPPSLAQIAEGLASGRPYYHLWYLYMLLGLYGVAPFVARAVVPLPHRTQRVVAVAGFGIAITAHHLLGAWDKLAPVPFVLWCLAYLPYALVGGQVRTLKMSPLVLGAAVAVSICVTIAVTYALTLAQNGRLDTGFYGYLSLSVVPMSLAIFSLLTRLPPRLASLAPLSFGLYLIHPLFLELIPLLPALPVPVALGLRWGAVTVASLVAVRGLVALPILRRLV